MKNPILSIVIVSYNTKEILKDCLKALEKVKDEISFEVIVVDNASSDGSPEVVEKEFPKYKLIKKRKNVGFSIGNNAAKRYCCGRYILFLNSDTLVHKNTLNKTVSYLEKNEDVGSITCKIVLPDGNLDKDSRRSFPTPWVAFTHLVFPLDRIFPRSRIFSKYWYGYMPEDKEHEVDVIQGAYHLTRKRILNKVGWFDEDYFLDGEDIDLCWRIKKLGLKIIYYPEVKITHIKKASKKRPNKINKRRFVTLGVDSMEMFYRKHMWDKYPRALSLFVILGIRIIKYLRIAKFMFVK